MVNGDYPTEAVQAGLRLVMTQNIFTFSDLTFKQLNGTAMGAPPAPPMQLCITVFMKKNNSHDTHNASYSITDSLTMSLVSGVQTKTQDLTQWNGTLSRIK